MTLYKKRASRMSHTKIKELSGCSRLGSFGPVIAIVNCDSSVDFVTVQACWYNRSGRDGYRGASLHKNSM